MIRFQPRTESERLAYLHGRADSEVEAWEIIRRARDNRLSVFFYGVVTGALTYAVIVAVIGQ